jgi:hypothetical protein
MAIPGFILRKLFVQGSFQTDAEGFFALSNPLAPVTKTGMGQEVDEQPRSPSHLTLQAGQANPALLPTTPGDGPRRELAAPPVTVLTLEI